MKTGQRVHLSLTANPSHLEAVDPVVEGRARAKQRMAGDLRGESVIPVLIHGDAAFAGQGMVAETLNLSNLAGYSTGGTIHVIVNNQIGFTTTPAEARSTLYATDVAKMIQVPIFHVNGDEPEAVVHCVKIAMEWRQRFGQDVVIDMICYRRHGHNEGDEPSFTQPLLYEKIRRKESVRKIYTDQLIARGILQQADVERIEADLSAQLRQALDRIETKPPGPDEPYEPSGPWRGFSRTEPEADPATAVPVEQLAQLSERLATTPPGFAVHPKLAAMLERRRKVVAEDGADRLGPGRGARVRDAAGRGLVGAPLGSGQRAGHVQPPPRRARRPEDGRGVHAARAPLGRSRRASRPTTACSPRPPCSASSTATAGRIRRRSRSGRRSSATSRTARSRSSTSSSCRRT